MNAPPARRALPPWVNVLVLALTMASLGVTVGATTPQRANDRSRWCTVWSLLERHSYVIDECPWPTVDKVYRSDPRADAVAGPSAQKHFYSSKPALLATAVAGLLAPLRAATGVPLAPQGHGRERPSLLQGLYFKGPLVLLNVLPFGLFLLLYARRAAGAGPEALVVAVLAAGLGSQLFAFNQTLNNHTVAAFWTFFAAYAYVRITEDGDASPRYFALAGLCAGVSAVNELPALVFLGVLAAMLLRRHPRRALGYFLPAAAVPLLAFLCAQHAAFGQTAPMYLQFGKEAYHYPGSYWNAPGGYDALNVHPEPRLVYLFNIVVGHHGVLSLTPIFLVAFYGLVRAWRRRPGPGLPLLTVVSTVLVVAFYVAIPGRNYGGVTQGFRWLFWLHPLWLAFVPHAVEPEPGRDPLPRWAVLAALAVSIFSAAYALGEPWSHPWLS